MFLILSSAGEDTQWRGNNSKLSSSASCGCSWTNWNRVRAHQGLVPSAALKSSAARRDWVMRRVATRQIPPQPSRDWGPPIEGGHASLLITLHKISLARIKLFCAAFAFALSVEIMLRMKEAELEPWSFSEMFWQRERNVFLPEFFNISLRQHEGMGENERIFCNFILIWRFFSNVVTFMKFNFWLKYMPSEINFNIEMRLQDLQSKVCNWRMLSKRGYVQMFLQMSVREFSFSWACYFLDVHVTVCVCVWFVDKL